MTIYRIRGGKLEYKDAAGDFQMCICPFRGDACGVACPHFRVENPGANGMTPLFLTCGGTVREILFK